MSSRAGNRPRTRTKQSGGGRGGVPSSSSGNTRPITRGKQRGFYSEVTGPHAAHIMKVSFCHCSLATDALLVFTVLPVQFQ